MKTAVSVPDEVFRAGEALAKRLRLSRSALYARALREFVRQHRDDVVTARLNEVYGGEDSALDPVLHAAQTRVLRRER